MDIVITYVNGSDPLWAADYLSTVGVGPTAKRFRDWGTLRYLLRAVEKNIPFARKVHLVVSRESQVPQWLDRAKVNVVLHRDFIPQEYLPLFNSSSIEVFLHRIPGLDEEFIYLNDDFFPVRSCTKETFFKDGRPLIGMHCHLMALNSYKKRIKRSYSLASSAAGVRSTLCFQRPQHICYNLLRSSCEELFNSHKTEILSSVTPLRCSSNYNISLYLDYIHLTGRSINKKNSNRHISLGAVTVGIVRYFIKSGKRDFLCINDTKMTERRFRRLQAAITDELDRLFPRKSLFETTY